MATREKRNLINALSFVIEIKNLSSLCRQHVRVFVNKTRTETVSNPFNKQPEFTARRDTRLHELGARL